VVHASPSLQLVPFGALGLEQVPVTGLHTPAWWHWSSAVQVTAVPPHVPLVHTSPVVHALLSLQEVPFGAAGFEHVPVAGLHVPTVWHASPAVQTTGLDPAQVPDWHV
jgi:hypothetical protein